MTTQSAASRPRFSSSISTAASTSAAARCTAFLAAATAATTTLLLLSIVTPATAAVFASQNNPSISLRGGLGLVQKPQQAGIPQFPRGACERSASKSPLRLSLDAVASSNAESSGSLQRFCFRVDNRGSCDPSSRCCDLAAAASSLGASKIEFDVVTGCKDAVRRVTINDKPSPFVYDVQLGVLRISGLNAIARPAAAAAAGGDQVCVFLDTASACPSLSHLCTSHGVAGAAGLVGAATSCRYAIFNADQDCCPVSFVAARAPLTPPPPPPPPPTATTVKAAAAVTATATTKITTASTTTGTTMSGAATTAAAAAWGAARSDFPYCQCQRDTAGSRLFATASPNVTTLDNGLTRICFDVGLRDVCPDPTSKCCEFMLYKMELEVDRTCAEALAYTSINGIQHVRFFQTAPHAAIKIVNLDRPVSAVNGTSVCLFLRPECGSLAKLCAPHDGTCTVGLFSKPTRGTPSCCPLSTVGL